MKYALAVAGLVSVVACVRLFGLDYRIAAAGASMVVLQMGAVVVVAGSARLSPRDLRLPALAITWIAVLFVAAVAAGLLRFTALAAMGSWSADRATTPPVASDAGAAKRPVPSRMVGTITLASDPGDYIGGGRPAVFSDANGKISAFVTRNTLEVNFRGDDWWNLSFAAPEGADLKVGTYEGAQRAAFHNPVRPGLDVSGAGRGSNRLTGRFVIRKLERSTDGRLERLEVEFEQHSEDKAPALRGTVNLVAGNPYLAQAR